MKKTIDILYLGFRPYVKKEDLSFYDQEFFKTCKNSLSYAKAFFPRFLDIKKCSAKPKKIEDTLLFNYYLTEMEVSGLKTTKLLKDFKSRKTSQK